MKKLLALNLALVLALGVASPAMAQPMLRDLDEPPFELGSEEVQTFLETLAEDAYAFTVDGGRVEFCVTPPCLWEYEYADSYAEYEAAHPEEFENMDVDALVAAWGYADMTAQEALLRDYSYYEGSVEEVVKQVYIEKRKDVEDFCQDAEEYRAEYPEEWENFDADAFYAEFFGDEDPDKAEFMAYLSILTDEEFAQMMFYFYAQATLWDNDWDYDWDDPEEEPALTLMVNGEKSDVAIAANDWTSYADAADLRSILGPEAVGQGYEGPVPIREAAENMGWDVVWYDGWDWQEVQLWDRAAFEAELADEFGPCDDFLTKVMDLGWERIFSEKPVSVRETADIAVTRFSTLNGNKDYKLSLELNYIAQKGVVDLTVTFDMAQLLEMIDSSTLYYLTYLRGEDDSTLEELTRLLKAGKMEFILDYNTGEMAYRIPLLGLLDESMADWQHSEFDVEGMGVFSLSDGLYEKMLKNAARFYWDGAQEALADYREEVANLRAVAGKDCFATRNGKTYWTVTTQRVNRAIGETLGLEQPDKTSIFKACELTCTLDDSGWIEMKLHLRPDVEGAGRAASESYDYTIADTIKYSADMDLTASFSGSLNRGTGEVKAHWDNAGQMDVRVRASTSTASQGPRQIKDVERLWVEPAPGTVLTRLETAGALR